MPNSISKMIPRTRPSDQSLTDIYIETNLLETPRPKLNTQLKRSMIDIYEIFKPFMFDKEHQFPYAPAHAFEHLKDLYSRPTVIKAKKMLGIKSIKVDNEWVWTFPARAPTQAEDQAHQSYIERWQTQQIKLNPVYKRERNLHRPSTLRLSRVMQQHGYDMLGKWAIIECGFSAQVVKRAKAALGIISTKCDDGWHWVYASPAVQEWLINLLEEGPRTIEEVVILAADKGWSRQVIELSRIAIRGIVFTVIPMPDGGKEPGWRII